MIDRSTVTTPPPEEPEQTKIKYKKNKARHGHSQDVTISNIRQVAGCLPIDPYEKRFLLISSRKNPGQWVIPKGGWETDETQQHAALRETWEEAGIKGKITHHIGTFVERNKKNIKAHHWIYEMQISKVKKKYPEKDKRERRWFTFEEALIAVGKKDYIRQAIQQSTLSPYHLQATPRSSLDEGRDSDSTPENHSESETSKDAFEILQGLMEKASIS